MSQWMSKYKCTMKREHLENLKYFIEKIIEHPNHGNDDDKMLCALLAEIKDKLYGKLGKTQSEYQISFSPAQAFAMRILYNDYVKDPTSYLGNKLHEIAMGVDQQYC